jgi:hypothetical protein
MDNEELLNKIKIYEQRILYLEKELNQTKEHLKKYTAPSYKKVYYENNKEEIKEKKQKYKPTEEQKKKWARTAYLKKKEKLEKEKIETQNI